MHRTCTHLLRTAVTHPLNKAIYLCDDPFLGVEDIKVLLFTIKVEQHLVLFSTPNRLGVGSSIQTAPRNPLRRTGGRRG